MTRPLVFLDIDGVLIPGRWIWALPEAFRGGVVNVMDPAAVARMNRLLAVTGADVVVSSTKRLMGLEAFCEWARGQGLIANVIGATAAPQGATRRGHEIAAWLLEHDPLGERAFVIVDDDSDMEHLKHRLVKTTFETGLLDDHVDRAIAMLRKAW